MAVKRQGPVLLSSVWTVRRKIAAKGDLVVRNSEETKFNWSDTLSPPLKVVREIVAIIFWASILTQLFVVDLGQVVVSKYPESDFLFKYRFLLIMGVVAFSWLILGNRLFLKSFGYIAIYPFLLAIILIPFLLIKNWVVAVAFSPAIYHFVRTFKSSFIIGVTVLIAAHIACLGPADSLWIPFSISLVGLYLVHHFFNRFRSAYSSSTIFSTLRDYVDKLWCYMKKFLLDNMPKEDLDVKEYEKELGKSLLHAYVLTTGLYFLMERLREIMESRKLDLYLLSSLVWTFVVSVLSFAVIYFGLFRIDQSGFFAPENAGLLDFVGFSFTILMTSSISEVAAVSGAALAITYTQLFVSLLLIVLLAFMILTSIREKYNNDLDGLIEELGEAADKSIKHIEENYQITLNAIERILVASDETVMKAMLGVRYGRHRADEIIEECKKLQQISTEPERRQDAAGDNS